MANLNLRETLLRTREDNGKPITQEKLASYLSNYIDSVVSPQRVYHWVNKSVPPVWQFVLRQFFDEKGIEVVGK